MKLVYVADTPPVPKISKSDQLKQNAYLLAQRLMHSKSAKRTAERIVNLKSR